MKRKRILALIAAALCLFAFAEGLWYATAFVRSPFLQWCNRISVDDVASVCLHYDYYISPEESPSRRYILNQEEKEELVSLLNNLTYKQFSFKGSGSLDIVFGLYIDGSEKDYFLKYTSGMPKPFLYIMPRGPDEFVYRGPFTSGGNAFVTDPALFEFLVSLIPEGSRHPE